MEFHTPPKFNSERVCPFSNLPGPKFGKDRLPTIHFLGAMLNVGGGINGIDGYVASVGKTMAQPYNQGLVVLFFLVCVCVCVCVGHLNFIESPCR